MTRQTYTLALYEKALKIAAEDMYESEIVETEMEDLVIGVENEYCDKEDWVESKMQEWITAAIDKEKEED